MADASPEKAAFYHSGNRKLLLPLYDAAKNHSEERAISIVSGGYCSFAYSTLASFRMGMSGSASFRTVKPRYCGKPIRFSRSV
jgi:hypothetical protein